MAFAYSPSGSFPEANPRPGPGSPWNRSLWNRKRRRLQIRLFSAWGLLFVLLGGALQGQDAKAPCPLAVDREHAVYKEILRAEVVGERQKNLQQLRTLYQCSWERSRPAFDALLRAGIGWAKDLSRVCSKGCLVPLVTLHQDLVRELAAVDYRNAGQEVRGSLDRVMELVHPLPGEAKSEDSLVARLRTRMGMIDRELGSLTDAEEEFSAAIKAQPSHSPALHALSALFEKRGEYSDARTYLRRLVDLNPLDEVAGLRLALVELRLGRETVALQSLEAVFEFASRDWVAEFAAQELVQELMKTGQTKAALELLKTARRRFPESQTLAIQDAYWADTLLPSRIPADDAGLRSNSRTNYNQWPEEEMLPLVHALEQDLLQGRRDLGRSLDLVGLRRRR